MQNSFFKRIGSINNTPKNPRPLKKIPPDLVSSSLILNYKNAFSIFYLLRNPPKTQCRFSQCGKGYQSLWACGALLSL